MACPRRAPRVEAVQSLLERDANGARVESERQAGAVEDLPHLVVPADLLVARQLVGEVDPGVRAARQAVDQDHRHPIGIVRLHEEDPRLDQFLARSREDAARLAPEARAVQRERIGSGEVGGEAHLRAVQRDALVQRRAIGLDRLLACRHHFLERGAGEAQHGGDGDVADLSAGEGVLRDSSRSLRRAGDELGPEPVATVDVADAGEAEPAGGDQAEQRPAGRKRYVDQATVDRPRVGQDGEPRVRLIERSPPLRFLEEEDGDPLGGAAEEIPHLVLAVLECALAEAAASEKEICVTGTRRLEIRIQSGVALAWPGWIVRRRLAEPELREGRQAPLVVESLAGLEAFQAGPRLEPAGCLGKAEDAQRLARGAARAAAAAERVGVAPLRHLPRLVRLHFHRCAAGDDQRPDQRAPDPPPWARPESPSPEAARARKAPQPT